jgi:CPA1 family monovalent cation:H+ antiporter
VFLLIGLTISFADLASAAGPIAWGVVAIVAGRIVVVYGFLGGLRLLAERVPTQASRGSEWAHMGSMPIGWLHVVFWSGLRGAVAFALSLAIPLDVPDRSLLQGTVFGIVLFTLLVQGTWARRVIAWAGLETTQANRRVAQARSARPPG